MFFSGLNAIYGSARQPAGGREEMVGSEMISGEMVEEIVGWVGSLLEWSGMGCGSE